MFFPAILGIMVILYGTSPSAFAQDDFPALTPIAYEGMPTPIGGVFKRYLNDTFTNTQFNDAGEVIFLGNVLKEGQEFRAIFRYSPPQLGTPGQWVNIWKLLTSIAAEGDPGPYNNSILDEVHRIFKITNTGSILF